MVWPHLTARPGWCGWPSRDRLSAAGDWAGAADAGNLLATVRGLLRATHGAAGPTIDGAAFGEEQEGGGTGGGEDGEGGGSGGFRLARARSLAAAAAGEATLSLEGDVGGRFCFLTSTP